MEKAMVQSLNRVRFESTLSTVAIILSEIWNGNGKTNIPFRKIFGFTTKLIDRNL